MSFVDLKSLVHSSISLDDPLSKIRPPRYRSKFSGYRVLFFGPMSQKILGTLGEFGVVCEKAKAPANSANLQAIGIIVLVGRQAKRLLNSIRNAEIAHPVLILGSKEPAAELLALGADDVQSRNIDAHELLFRLDALVRRDRTAPSRAVEALPIGRGIYNTCTRTIVWSRNRRTLSVMQGELMRLLLAQPGQIVPYGRMEPLVASNSQTSKRRSLSVHMVRLRDALEGSIGKQLKIEVERGVGYRLVALT